MALSTLITIRSLAERLTTAEHCQFIVSVSQQNQSLKTSIISNMYEQLTRNGSIDALLNRMKYRSKRERLNKVINCAKREFLAFLTADDIVNMSLVSKETFCAYMYARNNSNTKHTLRNRFMFELCMYTNFLPFVTKFCGEMSQAVFAAIHASYFDRPSKTESETQHQTLTNIKSTISKLIRSRSKSHAQYASVPVDHLHTTPSFAIDSIPSDMIGKLASFLPQHDYFNLSKTNRSMYIGCNSPNKLEQLELIHDRARDGDEKQYDEIDFSKFAAVRRINLHKVLPGQVMLVPVDSAESLVLNLLNVRHKEIRKVSYMFIRSKMEQTYTLHGASQQTTGFKARIADLVDVMMQHLPMALEIAANRNLIEEDNTKFPDDLKSYTERLPKLACFWKTLGLLLEKFPEITRDRICRPANWSRLTQILHALEEGAVESMWGKNDDKLQLLQVIQRAITNYDVRSNKQLIDLLTKHFLVSTRSDYVAEHMQAVVVTTFELLTKFAMEILPQYVYEVDDEDDEDDDLMQQCGEEEEEEYDEDEDEDSDLDFAEDDMEDCVMIECADRDENHWIKQKLMGKYWFHWALTDIVAPHHVYNGPRAAETILKFLHTISRLPCMNRERQSILEQVCRKWQNFEPVKTIQFHPRNTVLQLLRILLQTESDHLVFLPLCHDVLRQWITNYFYHNTLKKHPTEKLQAFKNGLDFFRFQVDAATKYESMRKPEMVKVVACYIDAISVLYGSEWNEYKHDEEWQCVFEAAQELLAAIFRLQKVYRSKNLKQLIIAKFMDSVASSDLFVIPSQIKDYLDREQNSKNQQSQCDGVNPLMTYFDDVIAASQNERDIKVQLHKVCVVRNMAKTGMDEDRSSPLMETFLKHYPECDQFQGSIAEQLKKYFVYVKMSSLFGFTFSEFIMKKTLSFLSTMNFQSLRCLSEKDSIVCDVLFCALMTSSAFKVELLTDARNMTLFESLTHSIFHSVEDENTLKRIPLRRLREFKMVTLQKYIPMRFRICIHKLKDLLQDTNCTEYHGVQRTCFPFIEYMHRIYRDDENMLMEESDAEKVKDMIACIIESFEARRGVDAETDDTVWRIYDYLKEMIADR